MPWWLYQPFLNTAWKVSTAAINIVAVKPQSALNKHKSDSAGARREGAQPRLLIYEPDQRRLPNAAKGRASAGSVTIRNCLDVLPLTDQNV